MARLNNEYLVVWHVSFSQQCSWHKCIRHNQCSLQLHRHAWSAAGCCDPVWNTNSPTELIDFYSLCILLCYSNFPSSFFFTHPLMSLLFRLKWTFDWATGAADKSMYSSCPLNSCLCDYLNYPGPCFLNSSISTLS